MQRTTVIRYRPSLAVEMRTMKETDDPDCSVADLNGIEERKLEHIEMMHEFGHGSRHCDAVSVDDMAVATTEGELSE